MTLIITLLLVACLGLAFSTSYLYDERNKMRRERNTAWGANIKMSDKIRAMEAAAPDIPAPAQDSFLELADLRRQLVETNEDLDRVTSIAKQSAAVCGQLERSNASLRGQITKLTPKKKK